MTSASLSQNEIDLLFSGGGAEQGSPTRPAVSSIDVQVYDFRKPARISKERNRSLLAMYGLLAKSMEGWIAGRVREQVEVEVQSVEQLTFGELVLALPSPCASYIVDLQGTERQGVLEFGHELAYFMVDRLLGGAGAQTVPARTLSTLERMIVRIIADRVSTLLSDAWKDYVRLDLKVTGFESIPEMLRVANHEDPVLVANLIVSTSQMSAAVMLSLPFVAVEKFFTGTRQRRSEQPEGSPEERRRDRKFLEATLSDSRMAVRARWPAFQVPLDRLASIRPGDVLATGITEATNLEVLLSDQRRFLGKPGRIGRHLAVQIVEQARPEPEEVIDAHRDRPLLIGQR